jgi:hypothetical protein
MNSLNEIYLGIFFTGFFFSAVSFLMGSAHSIGLHLPFTGHGSHGFHGIHGVHAGQSVQAGHGVHGGPSGHSVQAAHSGNTGSHSAKFGKSGVEKDGISPFNAMTISAFLTWFGGSGVLLHYYLLIPALPDDLISTLSGIIGGGIVFWGMGKLYTIGDQPMDPSLSDKAGNMAKVSAGIPANGVGEVSYDRDGSPFVSAARSVDGEEIAKGVQVVILKHEKGMTWVQPYEKFMSDEKRNSTDEKKQHPLQD